MPPTCQQIDPAETPVSTTPASQAVRIASRANRAATVDVLLDPLGDVRLSSFSMMDFRLDKEFSFGTMRVIPSMDVFNILNSNTVLARRRLQEATNANDISGIVAPRVIRFGVRLNW